jgi:hypothetical protein
MLCLPFNISPVVENIGTYPCHPLQFMWRVAPQSTGTEENDMGKYSLTASLLNERKNCCVTLPKVVCHRKVHQHNA